ncbi:MAG: tetratricopeptide repeat protein [Gammaproteobacteria bacterium]|nr:tetratricopeptide repeat protein [Gammaproteobacteria bacterium]
MSQEPNNVTPERLFQEAYRAHQAGQAATAERLYLKLLELTPADVDAGNLLGLLYLQTGRPKEAVGSIQKAIHHSPDDAQAHYNLGLALKEADDPAAAAHHFRESARLEPRNPEPSNALGNVLRKLDMPDAAIDSFRDALAVDPKHVAARTGLSDALNDLGVARNSESRTDDALSLFSEATAANKGNADAWINLGILREQSGDLEGAASAYKFAIAAKPAFINAHFHLAHLSEYAISEEDMDAMRGLIGSSELDPEGRALLAYGLACGYEKQGNYEKEFESLRQAHAIKAERSSFDLGRIHQRFEAIRNTFAEVEETLAERNRNLGDGLVFVVGMPRSGTTLAEQILASHADVHGCGESGLIAKAAIRIERAGGLPYPASLSRLSDSALREIADESLAAFVARAPGASTIIDTTPTNFIQCGLIATLWPDARIIHCMRHPLDICLSIYQNALSDDHAYAHDFATLAGYYLEYDRLMQHWHSVLPSRILELRYDRLVADFEATVKTLLDFCGLPFDDACLRFHETKRVVKTPSAGQVRKPIYAGSLNRWRKYREPLEPLRAKLATLIERFESGTIDTV